MLSYAGSLCVGVNADPDRVVELDKLKTGVEDAFACLRTNL